MTISDEDPEQIRRRAVNLRKSGDFAAAKQLLLSLLPVHEERIILWLTLGDIEKAAGNLQDAGECFRRAVAIDPLDELSSKMLFYVCWGLARRGDVVAWTEALAELERFLSVSSSDWHVQMLQNMRWLSQHGGPPLDALPESPDCK